MGNRAESENDLRTREVLRGIAEAGGILLRVEREPAPGVGDAFRSRRLRLIFDVSSIELHAESGGVAVGTNQADSVLARADEDEPWWTVIGSPLTRVAAQEDGGSLVQFRADDASPKLFVLVAEGETVVVRVVI